MKDTFLEDLYREMYNNLYHFARVKLNDEQLAQEIVQDVFVLAQEKIELLRQSPNPRGWLIKTTNNTILHALRTKQTIKAHFVPLDEKAVESIENPHEEIGLRELLSIEEWNLLRNVYCDGYSIKEAAILHNISFEACRKRLYRIKQRLRIQFNEERTTKKGGENDAG